MTKRTLTLVRPSGQQHIPATDFIANTCENCRFFNMVDEVEAGECRRRPPRIVPVDHVQMWPHCLPSDWCGEFKRLPVANG